MNEAQKIAQAVGSAVTAQSEEIIDFLKQKGFTDISVHFGEFTREREIPPPVKHLFTLHIDAKVDPAGVLEADGQ